VETRGQVPVKRLEEPTVEDRPETVDRLSDTTADELDEHSEPPSTLSAWPHWHRRPFDLNHPLISPRVKQVLSQVALMYPDHVPRTVQSIVTVRSNFERMNKRDRPAYVERYELEAGSPGNDYLYYVRMRCIVDCMRSGEWG